MKLLKDSFYQENYLRKTLTGLNKRQISYRRTLGVDFYKYIYKKYKIK